MPRAGHLLALLAGCTDTEEAPEPTGGATWERTAVLDPWLDAVSTSDVEAANVVVLGDSVSEGYGLSNHLERRWVDRLQAGLRQRAGAPGCPTPPGGWHGTTSLVPADYLDVFDPLRKGADLRGRVVRTIPRTGESAVVSPLVWEDEVVEIDTVYPAVDETEASTTADDIVEKAETPRA